ncbi:phosphomannomutase/phosphoglucomutase [Spiractinospora alimapuensis]|uniref:phosphomannomutase/phosphoglucomutase n=1 Tax=Spiractinospora alimapuensis TaxID=2820884 RepID=UPI001F15D7B8|nr:phosphomannomutase/phosphoglucomutase [Spiractinospora alimapuensis]QVQ54375.1 phosphomannomutase/phosphoglucomutase [Spiractinospora alimapuensis]
MRDLGPIFKAYDVRGVVPDALDTDVARAIGAAFADFNERAPVVVAHDMRPSSPALAAAFAEGAADRGSDVTRAGLGSTDLLYFVAGHESMAGAMFTASHNPAQYNGIKMCGPGATPIGEETGLTRIRALAERDLPPVDSPGTVRDRDYLADYATYLRSLVDLSDIRTLRVVIDAGNGMAGHTVPAVLGDAVGAAPPLSVDPLYFELDGTFPNHPADPMNPKNTEALRRRVRDSRADLGLAFDGDADRCFVVDERGEPVPPSAITALVATRQLAVEPGGTVIHNLITSTAVPEIVREHGGTPIRTRVGHSFIKARMAETGAIFGGEHSGHYYFREFWRADTGMLAALHVLAALGHSTRPLSELAAEFSRYSASGEINSEVSDQAERTAAVRSAFAGEPGVEIDELDGLSVLFGDGSWFNLRPSNTEPLLRLNVEGADEETMRSLRDRVLEIVRA